MFRSVLLSLVSLLAWIPAGFPNDATTPPLLTPEEVEEREREGIAPNTDRMPATGLHLGQFRIDFERTRLVEVALAIPSGPLSESGQDHGYFYWLCYTLEQAQQQRLWITSDGEFGGPERAMDGAIATALPEGEGATADCPLLPPKYYPVSLDDGVWLGLTRLELAAKFPSAPMAATNRTYFEHVRPILLPSDEFATSSYLEVEFRNDRVFRLRASLMTSN